MKVPASLEKVAAKFDRLSLRERVLATAAAGAAIAMLWVVAILDPLSAKQRSLTSEISGIHDDVSSTLADLEAAAANDPVAAALLQEKTLQSQLSHIDVQLASESAGLIPPQKMVELIHDVLSRQRGIRLISLQNKPMTSLIRAVDAPPGEGDAKDKTLAPIGGGPYMHPVELIVEGRYLDVLAYLRALEELPWHFYWQALELESTQYPLNRVRIEVGTLSMDKDWIGV